jgi:Flp pilus assembly protein TadD
MQIEQLRTLSAALTLMLAGGCGAALTHADPTSPLDAREVSQLRYEMARRLVQQRDYEHALPYLQNLLRTRPDDLRLRLMHAEVLREKGMHRAAKRDLELILERAPKHAGANRALGVLLDLLGRHGQAERHHRRAVKAAPGDPRGHNNLGFCLFLQHRLEPAQKALSEAIRLDPSYRRAFNNLGFVYGLQGKRADAREAFNQAGSEALALNNLGMVEEMRGQPLQARRLYERALRVQPGYRPALRNLRALEVQIHGEGGGGGEEAGGGEEQREKEKEAKR